MLIPEILDNTTYTTAIATGLMAIIILLLGVIGTMIWRLFTRQQKILDCKADKTEVEDKADINTVTAFQNGVLRALSSDHGQFTELIKQAARIGKVVASLHTRVEDNNRRLANLEEKFDKYLNSLIKRNKNEHSC